MGHDTVSRPTERAARVATKSLARAYLTKDTEYDPKLGVDREVWRLTYTSGAGKRQRGRRQVGLTDIGSFEVVGESMADVFASLAAMVRVNEARLLEIIETRAASSE